MTVRQAARLLVLCVLVWLLQWLRLWLVWLLLVLLLQVWLARPACCARFMPIGDQALLQQVLHFVDLRVRGWVCTSHMISVLRVFRLRLIGR